MGRHISSNVKKIENCNKKQTTDKLSQGILLLHDNARPHTARNTVSLIESFRWKIFTHPLYSPDHAPSDYHFFPRLKQDLGGQTIDNDGAQRVCYAVLQKLGRAVLLVRHRKIDLQLR